MMKRKNMTWRVILLLISIFQLGGEMLMLQRRCG